MKPINPLLLIVIGLCVALAGWFATALTTRYSLATPVLPLTGLVTMGVIVVLTLVLGVRVLRWRNGKKKKMLNPILAAWTLVLAQACAYTGTVLLGWHAGIFVDQLRLWNLRSTQAITWQTLAMAGGGLVMVVVGLSGVGYLSDFGAALGAALVAQPWARRLTACDLSHSSTV